MSWPCKFNHVAQYGDKKGREHKSYVNRVVFPSEGKPCKTCKLVENRMRGFQKLDNLIGKENNRDIRNFSS